jgi:hypothetical protein
MALGQVRHPICRNAADSSPSPGGDGRGEDERETPSLKLVLTSALILSFSPEEKEQRIVSSDLLMSGRPIQQPVFPKDAANVSPSPCPDQPGFQSEHRTGGDVVGNSAIAPRLCFRQ